MANNKIERLIETGTDGTDEHFPDLDYLLHEVVQDEEAEDDLEGCEGVIRGRDVADELDGVEERVGHDAAGRGELEAEFDDAELESVQQSHFGSQFVFWNFNLQIEMQIGAQMRRTVIPHLKPILNTSK